MEVVKASQKTENTLNIVKSSASAVQSSESFRGENAADKATRTIERTAYSELPGLRHETKDVLKQLQANIQMLEDLGGRLGFVMSEVRSIIRR